ncbi:MAG: fucose isomerase [Firmicutes bacterium]|jgi:L-fucose isomerase-like protein|nr:fucose isomerase [Bacillota bacterium]
MDPKRYSVRLGVLPTERYGFGHHERMLAAKQRVTKKLEDLGIDMVTVDGVTENGTVHALDQVGPVVAALEEAGVDALFFPHCNFGSEETVAHIAQRMKKPVLIWGERDLDERREVSSITDRQCGLFATGKALRRFGIPFSYIENCRVHDPQFVQGVQRFLAASRVVKAFRGLRIGQIGTRPTPFLTMMCNEGELLEKFGITVSPVSLVDIIEDARELMGSAEQREQARVFQETIPVFEVDREGIDKMAALKLAISRWAEQSGCSAVVIQCWQALRRSYGIGTCMVNAFLTEEGLPVACETDIHGAVTSVLLQAAVGGSTPTFFADLTVRHPEDDNKELLWHCGPFPFALWDRISPVKVTAKGQAFWRIRGGDITVARFDGDRGQYVLAAGHAKGVDGPETWGTYLWMEVNDWPAWERRFVEGPYVHHVSVVHGHVADVLAEAVRFIDGLGFERLP